jgi:hypothetical protein
MNKTKFEMTMDETGCQLVAFQNDIPLCEWSGDLSQVGLGFLELVSLLVESGN